MKTQLHLITLSLLCMLLWQPLQAQSIVDFYDIVSGDMYMDGPGSGSTTPDGDEWQLLKGNCAAGDGVLRVDGNSIFNTFYDNLEFAFFTAGADPLAATPVVGWTFHFASSETNIAGIPSSAPGVDVYVRDPNNTSEWALFHSGATAPAGTAVISAEATPTSITHADCGQNNGAVAFTGATVTDGGDEVVVGQMRYGLFRTSNGNPAGQNTSGSFSSLSPAEYVLYVWDDGVETSAPSSRPTSGCFQEITTFTINTNAPFSVTAADISTTNAPCSTANGSFTITPTPAATDYVFSFDGGNTYTTEGAASFTNNVVSPNTYGGSNLYRVAKLGDTDCNIVVPSFTVGNDNLSADLSGTDAITTTNAPCTGQNGSVTLTPSPARSDYFFSTDGGTTWTATGAASYTNDALAPDTYTNFRVSIGAAGSCPTDVPSFTVGNDNLAADLSGASAVATTNAICAGDNGSVTITPSPARSDYFFSTDGGTTWTATGAASYTNDALAPDTYDDFRVSIGTAGVCPTDVPSFTINEPMIGLSVAAMSMVDCEINGTAVGGWGNYEYALSNDGPWQSSDNFDNLTAGSYTVYARDGEGCVESSSSVTVACNTSRQLRNAGIAIQAYPNPTSGDFRLQASGIKDNKVRVELVDLLGKVVVSQEAQVVNSAMQLEMHIPHAGMYFIRIHGNGGQHLQRVIRN